jgi:uncharacterized phage protein (TIGR02220 family)
MILIDFITQFIDKPKQHGDIWFYILCRTNRKIYINEIMYKYNISKSSLYRIFSLYKTDIISNKECIVFKIKNSYIYSNTEESKKTIKKTTSKKVKNILVESEIIDIENKSDIYIDIIKYLNEKSGKRYSYKNAQTKKYINARIKEGYDISHFKKVIDIKCVKWLNSTMEDYLRPQTLFSNKFEGYINETLSNKKDTVEKTNETINKAKQFNWEFDS